MGLNTNIEINRYLTDVSGFDKSLPALSRELFSKHTDVFADCKWSIDKTDPHFPVLTVKKAKNTFRRISLWVLSMENPSMWVPLWYMWRALICFICLATIF